MLAAAIGIGSNSLRMLIAELDPVNAQLHRVLRPRRVRVLLPDEGRISGDDRRPSASGVCGQGPGLSPGEDSPCSPPAPVGTCSQQAAATIERAVGIRPDVCSGEMEAWLSFGLREGTSGMIDIGAAPRRSSWAGRRGSVTASLRRASACFRTCRASVGDAYRWRRRRAGCWRPTATSQGLAPSLACGGGAPYHLPR